MSGSILGSELIGRRVVDSQQDMLGILQDLIIDPVTGSVMFLLVEPSSDIDTAILPWPSERGLVEIPSDEINRVGVDIHLNK